MYAGVMQRKVSQDIYLIMAGETVSHSLKNRQEHSTLRE